MPPMNSQVVLCTITVTRAMITPIAMITMMLPPIPAQPLEVLLLESVLMQCCLIFAGITSVNLPLLIWSHGTIVLKTVQLQMLI